MYKKTKLFAVGILLTLSLVACTDKNGTTPTPSESSPSPTNQITEVSPSPTAEIDTRDNRMIILQGDQTDPERNRLLKEDIEFFAQEFPKKHKNPFSILTEQQFNEATTKLINDIDQLNNTQVFTELSKILVSVGDAHTYMNYWDGYTYPLQFWIFNGDVYIVDADEVLEEMLYSKVTKINDRDIHDVLAQLTTLISHENDNWALARLPEFLGAPIYMYGLGIIPNETETKFTVKNGDVEKEYIVPSFEYEKYPNWIVGTTKGAFIGKFEKYYDYEYIQESNTLYFEYNTCQEDNSTGQSFDAFNTEMFKETETNHAQKIIIDLRSNRGGDSEILNPFTEKLNTYIKDNPSTKVYILVGRNSFSSATFAVFRTLEAAPGAITVGESTGFALDCYGDVQGFSLPNSQLPVQYSTKFFEFSSLFNEKNMGVKTFVPDILLEPSIDDYRNGIDVVKNYALEN